MAHLKSVLIERQFTITEPGEFDLTEDQEREWIKKHLDSPTSVVLVAEVEGRIVGLLDCECGHRRRLAHRAKLGLTVKKEHRGRGVGSALMQALVDWAEGHATITKLGLAVLATNTAAIGLYRKYGFVEEGRRPREVKIGPDQYVDDILMYRFVD